MNASMQFVVDQLSRPMYMGADPAGGVGVRSHILEFLQGADREWTNKELSTTLAISCGATKEATRQLADANEISKRTLGRRIFYSRKSS